MMNLSKNNNTVSSHSECICRSWRACSPETRFLRVPNSAFWDGEFRPSFGCSEQETQHFKYYVIAVQSAREGAQMDILRSNGLSLVFECERRKVWLEFSWLWNRHGLDALVLQICFRQSIAWPNTREHYLKMLMREIHQLEGASCSCSTNVHSWYCKPAISSRISRS